MICLLLLWSILDRQADVALGQRGSGRMRAHQIFELGALDPAPNSPRQGSDAGSTSSPRESLGQPDAAQAQLRSTVPVHRVAAPIKSDQRARQVADVAGCQIQPFGRPSAERCARHRRQEQAGGERTAEAGAKRIGSTRNCARARCFFSIEGPVARRSATCGSSRSFSSAQKRSIGPFFDPLGQRALQIVAAPSVRAHAAQREAAFMVGVDELILHRRGIR